jgi:hypothetical protein
MSKALTEIPKRCRPCWMASNRTAHEDRAPTLAICGAHLG